MAILEQMGQALALGWHAADLDGMPPVIAFIRQASTFSARPSSALNYKENIGLSKPTRGSEAAVLAEIFRVARL